MTCRGVSEMEVIGYRRVKGVNHKTNVSRPQLKSNQSRDKALPNNSQVKLKKTQVEVHLRIPSVSNKMKSVTACKDSLNSKTLNANAVFATCNKCLVDSNHFACVTKMLNAVNARTKKPNLVPISTRKPKSQANKSVATHHKKKVASKSTNQKPQSYFRMLMPQQNGVVDRRNRTLVEAARTMLTFANLLSFLWAEAIATACFTQNRSIIHKRFDKTPYKLTNKRKPNIKFFCVFGCRCYLFNDYEDVGKLKAKGDIRVFVGYSKESAAFRIYNKQTRKIHESVNVNFDEISEMASKQFSLELDLSNLIKTEKSSNQSVSQVSETSKKDLEDLFQDFYDEYFDSSKIMKSSTKNVETPINEKVFHEVSESFQGESSSSSLNDHVQQSPKEVILPQTNTQSIPINMVPNGDEASTSHNVFNEQLEDAYFDASTSFHGPSNVHTYYQPYPHEKKWTKDHPLHKIIGDPKSSVCTRGQIANSCLFSCLLSSIEPANVDEALRDTD
uniref:Integrase catalytic domain-containing protein n=1 Tax=Tanacetum cinerariifolium TaxID=118510 RepID=A0A6L2N1N7_TANCI|nr:hypothetical protein [Tanacetum cinerariifolium]